MKRTIHVILLSALTLLTAYVPARAGDEDVQKDKMAFLGVSTSPIDRGISEHIGLPEGVGLSVDFISPDSAASGVLKVNDILHKLDDQLLISQHQLAVLIRSRNPGTRVKLNVIRKGKPMELDLTLGERDYSPLQAHNWNLPSIRIQTPRNLFVQPRGTNRMDFPFGFGGPDIDEFLAEVEKQMQTFGDTELSADNINSMLKGILGGSNNTPADVQLKLNVPEEENRKIQTHVSTLSTAIYTTVLNGIIATLKVHDGNRYFTVKDSNDKVIFDGPVNTDKEKEKVPEEYRGRLLKILENQARNENSKIIN